MPETRFRPRTPRRAWATVTAMLQALTHRWHTARTAALSVAGFGCLTAAAWTLHTAAGLTAAGLSLLALEALSGGEDR